MWSSPGSEKKCFWLCCLDARSARDGVLSGGHDIEQKLSCDFLNVYFSVVVANGLVVAARRECEKLDSRSRGSGVQNSVALLTDVWARGADKSICLMID